MTQRTASPERIPVRAYLHRAWSLIKTPRGVLLIVGCFFMLLAGVAAGLFFQGSRFFGVFATRLEKLELYSEDYFSELTRIYQRFDAFFYVTVGLAVLLTVLAFVLSVRTERPSLNKWMIIGAVGVSLAEAVLLPHFIMTKNFIATIAEGNWLLMLVAPFMFLLMHGLCILRAGLNLRAAAAREKAK